jgi:phosphoglycolate phosphatase
MTPVDLLMFDLDGTLIDSRKDIADAVNRTFRDLGLPEKPREVVYGHVGNGVRRLITDTAGGFSPDLVDRALKIFETHYLEHLLDETRFYAGIEEVLERFQGKKIGVVTNKPILYTRRILEGLGADERFDMVIGGEEAVPLKPHPGMILRMLRHLQVRADRAVMIGDSVNDIEAARAAGVMSCAVGYGLGVLEELRRAEPDFFSEKVEDLKNLFH